MKRMKLTTLLATVIVATPLAAEPLTLSTATLTTDAATRVAQVALEECRKGGYVVAVAVVDRGGSTLALLRDNLAGAHTPRTAIGKAWTAVSFRNDTTNLLEISAPGQPSAGIRDIPDAMILGGGLTINAKGVLLGGIGVSGAPSGAIDDDCGRAGIASIQDALEFE